MKRLTTTLFLALSTYACIIDFLKIGECFITHENPLYWEIFLATNFALCVMWTCDIIDAKD